MEEGGAEMHPAKMSLLKRLGMVLDRKAALMSSSKVDVAAISAAKDDAAEVGAAVAAAINEVITAGVAPMEGDSDEPAARVRVNTSDGPGHAMCSLGDYDQMMNDGPWHTSPTGYVFATRDKVSMSQHIVGKAPKGYVIDHVNRNKLDNRRSNLRFVTRQFNAQNLSKRANATSRYMGVHRGVNGKWLARIMIDGVSIQLGTFVIEEDAARERDAYIFHHPNRHEMGFTLNFPGVDYTNHVFKKNRKYQPVQPKDPTRIRTQKVDISDTCIRLITRANDRLLIDADVYDRVKYYRCGVKSHQSRPKQAFINVDNKCVRLSRFLMNANDPDVYVDHINGDPLDNRLINLRFATPLINAGNAKKKHKAGTVPSSRYIGVYYDRQTYVGKVRRYNVCVFSVRHPTSEVFCARNRDIFLIDNRDKYSQRLNFNDWTPELIETWRAMKIDM